jgi:ADP-heptose:LPS heptosyltransferase
VAEPREWRGFSAKLKLAAQLRRGGFDTVLCCNGGATWPSVTLWAGIPQRIGILPNFSGRNQQLANRLWSAGVQHRGERMIVDTYFDMLRVLDLKPVDARKEVVITPAATARVAALLPQDKHPRIGLAISAANKLKELGTAKQADLVGKFLDAWPPAFIVLLGGPGDRAQAAALHAAIPLALRPQIFDSCGALELVELPALLAQLDLFVGVDSGLTYMADALELPLVSVAGPCNMRETGPVNPHARIIQKSMPCLPCAHIFRAPTACRIGTRACIGDVGCDEIVAAAQDALKDGVA